VSIEKHARNCEFEKHLDSNADALEVAPTLPLTPAQGQSCRPPDTTTQRDYEPAIAKLTAIGLDHCGRPPERQREQALLGKIKRAKDARRHCAVE